MFTDMLQFPRSGSGSQKLKGIKICEGAEGGSRSKSLHRAEPRYLPTGRSWPYKQREELLHA